MPRSASVKNRHGGAVASTTPQTTICQRWRSRIRQMARLNVIQSECFTVNGKLIISCASVASVHGTFLSFLEKCRPFTDEQEFGAGKRWEWPNLFTKEFVD